jgi:hypothetical protein
MQSLLFGVTMLTVAWLVLWCCADHSKPGNSWWPFDMRSRDPVAPDGEELKPQGALRRTRQNPTRPWKRSGF